MRYRTDFNPSLLGTTPDVLELGPWRLHYLAFANSTGDSREPVLMLGGAFQSFRSFANEVQELLAEHPVILLDLPGQGGNLQEAGELSLEQLADLIAGFAESLDLPPLMPIGLSYGSTLAALFASRHPQRCARLLLSGITAFGRPGSRRLLEEGLSLLAEGRQQAFAQAALNNLLNPQQLQHTDVAPAFRKALLRQMQRLSAAEIARYRQNSQRLLDFAGFRQHPQCPTLVLAGEFDHFTQPWEQALFAAACPQGRYSLIQCADHLAQFERREACAALYQPFLRGEPVPEQVSGGRTLASQHLTRLERRSEARRRPQLPRAQLRHAEAGSWSVEVSELGFFGGKLNAALPTDLPARGWQLQWSDRPALEILPLQHSSQGFSFVTLHSDADASGALAAQLLPAPLSACA